MRAVMKFHLIEDEDGDMGWCLNLKFPCFELKDHEMCHSKYGSMSAKAESIWQFKVGDKDSSCLLV